MKKFIAMLFVVCIVFSLCACGSSGGSGESLTFATGGESGTYYAFGSVLAQYVSNNTDIKITAVVGNGSQANVEDLDSGAVQLGFCQSDVMSYAYSGTNLFAESGAVDSFSVAAALYMEQVQIVTTNPDIKTVEDLKGKTVSIGALGSGVYFNAVDVLGVYGIDAEKDITPVYQSFGDSAESLKDGIHRRRRTHHRHHRPCDRQQRLPRQHRRRAHGHPARLLPLLRAQHHLR